MNRVTVLHDAEPADKTESYSQLGISLVYNANGTVTVESRRVGQSAYRKGEAHREPTSTRQHELHGRLAVVRPGLQVAPGVEYIERQSLWLDLKIMLLISPSFLADRSALG